MRQASWPDLSLSLNWRLIRPRWGRQGAGVEATAPAALALEKRSRTREPVGWVGLGSRLPFHSLPMLAVHTRPHTELRRVWRAFPKTGLRQIENPDRRICRGSGD